jgi:hypothetical protein
MITIRPALSRADAIERLRPVERRATDSSSAEDMAYGCDLLDVIEGDQVVGAAAVEVLGTVATIKAAASIGVHAYEHLALIEQWLKGRGCTHVGMFTKRMPLALNLIKCGYEVKEIELLKVL